MSSWPWSFNVVAAAAQPQYLPVLTSKGLTLFIAAPYVGVPWPGLVSAGSSYGRDLVTAGADPEVGTGAGGYASADFDAIPLSNVTGLSSSIMDIDGGDAVLITGDGFTGTTGASGVTVGGTNAVSYTVLSSTEIIAVLPAKAAGTHAVQVTGPGGAGTTQNIEAWYPGTETSVTLVLERTDYEVGTWTARKGSTTWAQATDANKPLEVSKDPDHDGIAHVLDNASAMSTWANVGAGFVALGYKADRSAAAATSVVDEPGFFCQAGGGTAFATSHTNSGYGSALYDGGWNDVRVAASNERLNIGITRWNGTNLYAAVNNTTWSSTPSGAASSFTAATYIGTNYAFNAFSDGRIRFVIAGNANPSDTIVGKIIDWGKVRHGVSTDGKPEIERVESDVIHAAAPKRVRIRGRNFGGTTAVYFGSSAATDVREAFKGTPRYDGSNDRVTASVNALSLWSNNAGTTIVLFFAYSGEVDGAAYYANPNFIGRTDGAGNAHYGVSLVDGAVNAGFYNGTDHHTIQRTCTMRAWHVAVHRWDTTNQTLSIDGGAEASHATGAGAISDDMVTSGVDYSGSQHLNARVALILTSTTKLSDANVTNVIRAINYRYGLNLGGVGAEDFDLSTLNLSGFWQREGYVVGTWTSDASAGSSSGRTLSQGTGANQPAVSENDVLICLPPTLSAGTYPVSVRNATGISTLSDAVEYYNALTARTWRLLHRVGDTGSRTTSGTPTVVTQLNDTGTAAETNRHLVTASGGSWGAVSAPRLNSADLAFGGEDSMGNQLGEERAMMTGTFASSETQPQTKYWWFKWSGTGDLYMPLDATANFGATFELAFAGGTVYHSVTGSGQVVAVPEGPRAIVATYDSAGNPDGWFFQDRYGIPDYTAANGTLGGSSETSMGVGNPITMTSMTWSLAMMGEVDGVDDLTTRRKMMRWGENFFQIPVRS